MKGIVDRLEGDVVVIEVEGVTQDVPNSIVELGVKAGDSVIFIDGIWITDESETKSRTKKIKELMDDLWED
jgi:hydrogenase maturation factor